jgi:cell division protease FtsH
MGGRVAEEITFGDITSGASGDIKQATEIAKNMVCKWGMSEKIGMIQYGGGEEHMFLARDFQKARDFSEKTAQEIDSEIKTIIDTAYQRAKTILQGNKEKLESIAKALLEFETLDAEDINKLLKGEKISREETLKTA